MYLENGAINLDLFSCKTVSIKHYIESGVNKACSTTGCNRLSAESMARREQYPRKIEYVGLDGFLRASQQPWHSFLNRFAEVANVSWVRFAQQSCTHARFGIAKPGALEM